jgi:hypothetical protein
MIITCGITSYKCCYIVRIAKHLESYYWSLLDHYLKFLDVKFNARLLAVGEQRDFPDIPRSIGCMYQKWQHFHTK